MKRPVAIVLSLCLGLFIAEGVVSLVDDSLIVALGVHGLDLIRGLLFLLALAAAGVTYLLMGMTPMVPKRLFLPVVLFNPLTALLVVPLSIYYYSRLEQIAWMISLVQVLVGLAVLYRVRRGLRLSWPLVTEEELTGASFSWLNLSSFVLVNLLILLPGTIVYLLVCTSLAVDHFTGGFLALHRDSLSVRARTYVRGDGKTIQLIPMMHIGEDAFYHHVAQSVPTNAVLLLEGVTDRRHLLPEKLSYNRMAKSLGMVEQRASFAPGGAMVRHADVDVEQFSSSTLEFLKTAIQLHARGITLETLRKLFESSQSPAATEQLWKDVLTRRNEHLLKEIQAELAHSQHLVVPWGAAHMPGVAEGIQKAGFHLSSSQEFAIFKFRTVWKRLRG